MQLRYPILALFCGWTACVSRTDGDTNAGEDRALEEGAGGQSTVADGAVGSAQLQADAVQSVHIANGEVTTEDLGEAAVTGTKIASQAVGAGNLARGAVDERAIANNAVTGAAVADNAIGSAELADSSVGESKLNDGAVSAAKLANNAVTTNKIAAAAITGPKIADNAVGSPQIAGGAVTTAKLADGAVVTTKIADATVNGAKLANDAVTSSKIAPNGVTNSDLVDNIDAGSPSAAGNIDVYDGLSSFSVVRANPYNVVGGGSTDGGRVRARFSGTGNTAAQLALWPPTGGGHVGVNQDAAGCCEAGLYYDPALGGVVYGDVKAFVQDHPTDPSLKIMYAAQEGPEASAYVRGTARLEGGMAVVELPAHFALVAKPEGITATVTPADATSLGLAVTDVQPEYLVVEELYGGTGTYAFHYRVEAVRYGYDDWKAVRPASDFVHEDGN